MRLDLFFSLFPILTFFVHVSFVCAWDIGAALADFSVDETVLKKIRSESSKLGEGIVNSPWKIFTNLGDQALRIKHGLPYDPFFDFSFSRQSLHEVERHTQDIITTIGEIKEHALSRGLDLEFIEESFRNSIEEVLVFFEQEIPDSGEGLCPRFERKVGAVLARFGALLIRKLVERGVDEDWITDKWMTIEANLKIVAMFACDHPLIFGAMIVGVIVGVKRNCVALWLLSLLGFGPLGPIKGSFAAWFQSSFWGAAVAKSSWFAWFQAAGMTKLIC
ncbi:hypothetical protein DL96DRAFT_1613448 [Flagelloscypha sp. PMI_526]|nr:hypothetical protein DL96DRAFT_1613448 [Flagelloscypha sp. PMI_526]